MLNVVGGDLAKEGSGSSLGAARGNAKNVKRNVPALADDLTKDLVKLFKLLSDETRLRILFFLTQQEEINVRTLCELLGQSQPAVSHHLALLRVAGLIEPRRDGKHNYYRLLPKRFQEVLGMLVEAAPQGDGRIQIENYVFSYTPVNQTP